MVLRDLRLAMAGLARTAALPLCLRLAWPSNSVSQAAGSGRCAKVV